ncbi:hypothetical protein GEMRC1_000553 [Eukaryota sp. GEM-RC1]
MHVLQDWRSRITDQDVQSLVEMFHLNSTLLVLNLEGLNCNSSQFRTMLKGLEKNKTLRKVRFYLMDLSSLIMVFDVIVSHKLIPCIELARHYIDVHLGLICFDNRVEADDLASLLRALKSNVPIQRVECLGFGSPSLEELVVLYEILFINKTVIDADISPHSIDVNNGLFCFSPEKPSQISYEEVSSLQTLSKRFSLAELTFKQCHFKDDTITIMSDFITGNSSLTSVDFNDCDLPDIMTRVFEEYTFVQFQKAESQSK